MKYSIVEQTAIRECKVLWQFLAETGITYKNKAIEHLYRKDQLLQRWYRSDCPLCEVFYCYICPWIEISGKGCMHPSSPYMKWSSAYRDKELSQKFAREVCKLLEEIQVEE